MNRSFVWWFAPQFIVRLLRRRHQPAIRAGSGGHFFPRILLPKKKKKKLFLCKNMGRKPWSPSCRIFLGRAGDRTEVSLCVGLVGLGGCHSEFFSSVKGKGGKEIIHFVCARSKRVRNVPSFFCSQTSPLTFPAFAGHRCFRAAGAGAGHTRYTHC